MRPESAESAFISLKLRAIHRWELNIFAGLKTKLVGGGMNKSSL